MGTYYSTEDFEEFSNLNLSLNLTNFKNTIYYMDIVNKINAVFIIFVFLNILFIIYEITYNIVNLI